MPPSLRVIALSLFCVTAPVLAQQTARVSAVTLYPGLATVERSVRVAAGARTLEIGGLPAGFDVRTLNIQADDGVRLGEFSVRDVPSAEAASPRQAELETRREALSDRIAVLDVERQSAELVTNYLQGLGQANDTPRPDAKTLGSTLDAIRQGGGDAYTRIQKVAVQKRELERQLAAVQRELDQIAGKSRDTRSLRLSLAAERAGEIRVSYQLPGPGWQPVYRASLDSASGQLLIERQALIAQASGEDWSDVDLRLSTGQPRTAPQGPQPWPWQLSLREPRPQARAATMALPAAPLMAKSAEADSAMPEAPLFEIGELQGMFATEFVVPVKVSLPGDGRKLTVALGNQRLPADLRVQVTPRSDATAYLVASAARPQGVWLPGQVQLYCDGAYVGATQWQADEGERLELPFGRDDLVRVEVIARKDQAGEGGFIEARRERQLGNDYVISNRHGQPVTLLLLEATPLAGDNRIRVESRFTPQPTQQDWQSRRGVQAWELPLAAGASTRISTEYRISWPREAIIDGL
ncbi:DUF4139 domain-containing protein [Candidatus Dactylopiibacterium carminicum]|nr:DUF4139 domain-containing protein [Candidatus Dactylopiibacterium carminicum]